MKIALVQMKVSDDTKENISRAHDLCVEAASQGADIVVLPEIFTCPYNSALFPEYAFDVNSTHFNNIKQIALDSGAYLVAGSIPLREEDGKIYNASFVFDKEGLIIARHRKTHLFDIDISGGQYFKESDTLTAGSDITVFDTDVARIGLMICYDIRFPELSRKLVDEGAELIIVPAAFNMTTGPAHWELSFRARALDNQVYYVGCAPARDEGANYVSYANSIVTSPWGEVIARAGTDEEILYADIDFAYERKIRDELPLLKHRRRDIY